MIRLESPVANQTSAAVAACVTEIVAELLNSRMPKHYWSPATAALLATRVQAYVTHGGDPAAIGGTTFPRTPPVPRTSRHLPSLHVPAPTPIPTLGDLMFHRYGSGTLKANQIAGRARQVALGHCPYCGLYMPKKPRNRSPDRDHSLPRSAFAEFSLLSVNLVVACDDCNTAKADRYVDVNGNWLFVHPYFDDFLNLRLIQVRFDIVDGEVVPEFAVAPTCPTTARDRVQRHVKELELFERYGDSPLVEFYRHLGTARRFMASGGTTEMVKSNFIDLAHTELVRPNDPLGHMFLAFAQHSRLDEFLRLSRSIHATSARSVGRPIPPASDPTGHTGNPS